MKKIFIISGIILSSIAVLFAIALVFDITLNIGLSSHIIKLNKAEKLSESKFEELFEKDFDDFEIKHVEQITDSAGFGITITDIAKCEVEIDNKQYLFFYDCHTDKFFSDFYYEQVMDEIEQHYLEKTPKELPIEDMVIFLSSDYSFIDSKTIRYEDRTFADILKRNQIEDYSLYDIEINYYIEKSAKFSPQDYALENIFEENQDIAITVLKADKEYRTDKNDLFVQEKYEYVLQENGDIAIYKKVNKKVKYNNIIFIYDKNLIDCEILPLNENDIEQYSNKIIRKEPINCGFKIKAKQKEKILEEEYENCIKTITSVYYYENTIRIMMDKETYLGKYMINDEMNKYLSDGSNRKEKYLYEFLPVYDEPIETTINIFNTPLNSDTVLKKE